MGRWQSQSRTSTEVGKVRRGMGWFNFMGIGLVSLLAISLVLAACGPVPIGGDSTQTTPTAGTAPTGPKPSPTPGGAAPTPVKPTPTPPAGATDTPAPGGATTSLSVYFMRGDKVGAASRTVPQTRSVGAAAVQELLKGPTDAERQAGLTTSIPAGTRFLGLSIENKVATVDLSKEFESGGGSLSMAARLAQVVYTLTQFPTVETVQFHLEGKAVKVFGGEGLVLDRPVGRDNYEDLTPIIFVESPTPGDKIKSPVRIWGTANTFEAMFMVKIVDVDGRTLVETPAMATSGSGTRGTYDITVPFTANRAGPGKLVVFEASAKDGSPIHVVEIPVELEK